MSEEAINTPLPSESHDAHSMGLLALTNSDVWETIRSTQEAMFEERRRQEQGGDGKQEKGGEEEHLDLGDGWSVGPSGSGIPMSLAMRFATRDEIDAAILELEPPLERPDMPLCQASELKVPKSFKEMLRSEHAPHFLDAQQREIHGVLQAKTFTPVDE